MTVGGGAETVIDGGELGGGLLGELPPHPHAASQTTHANRWIIRFMASLPCIHNIVRDPDCSTISHDIKQTVFRMDWSSRTEMKSLGSLGTSAIAL